MREEILKAERGAAQLTAADGRRTVVVLVVRWLSGAAGEARSAAVAVVFAAMGGSAWRRGFWFEVEVGLEAVRE